MVKICERVVTCREGSSLPREKKENLMFLFDVIRTVYSGEGLYNIVGVFWLERRVI